jgi:hypothetical protein
MHRSIISALAVAALAGSAPAYAQTSSYDTYGGKGQVEQEVERGSTTPATPSGNSPQTTTPNTPVTATPQAPVTPVREVPKGTLPFTGFDIGLLLVGGGVLLGLGVAMRRLSRPRGADTA